MNTQQNTDDLSQTADLAEASGLFSTPAQSQSKPLQMTKPKRQKPAAKQQERTDNSTTIDQDTNTADLASIADYSDEQDVFTAIKAVAGTDNPTRFLLARKIAKAFRRILERAEIAERELERYLATAQAAKAEPPEQKPPAREARELLSADQVARIISDTLANAHADGKLTGSDAKGLTATLRELAPQLFVQPDSLNRPSPDAIIEYVCHIGGATPEQIMAEMGGKEILADKLSAILKIPVSLGD